MATYNTHYSDRGLAGLQNRVGEMGADIVALQEVLASPSYDHARAIAARSNYRSAVSSPYVRYGTTAWLLAILSRHPILKIEEKALGSRRALRTLIDVHGHNLEVVTLHLTPLAGPNSSTSNIRQRTAARRKELQILIHWLKGSPYPQIVAGDFNMLRATFGILDMGEYSMMLEAGYEDADGSWLPMNSDTFPIPEETRQKVGEYLPGILIPDAITLDYVFYSEGISVDSIESVESAESDHYPLVGDFRLDNCQ
ncbi:MAG: endonuclease/exonuclease/phosphatase family protein [Leptospiraceae bacterium]|nr:endonuclease/exonuclease/phosphatase family protein [Leptospiraceae bacterium]